MNTAPSPRLSMAWSATAAILVAALVAAITILTWPSSAVANETEPCTVGVLLPPVGLQPGESMRVSILDSGEMGDGSVWGVRLRSADGKVVAAKQFETKPGVSVSLHHVIPPMPATQGDQRRAFTDLSTEIVLLQGQPKSCSTPLASVQGFDVQGRSTFLIAEWPPNPFRGIQPSEGDTFRPTPPQ